MVAVTVLLEVVDVLLLVAEDGNFRSSLSFKVSNGLTHLEVIIVAGAILVFVLLGPRATDLEPFGAMSRAPDVRGVGFGAAFFLSESRRALSRF